MELIGSQPSHGACSPLPAINTDNSNDSRPSNEQRQVNRQTSLGISCMSAHGLSTANLPIVVCNSFVTGEDGPGLLPKNLLPSPEGDAYLNFSAIPTLGDGETALTLTVQPGIIEYYRQAGIIPSSASVIEVNPSLGTRKLFGYPFTDPVSLLRTNLGFESGYFIATFPLESCKLVARRHGLETVQSYDVATLNDKAAFREASQASGYSMLPGIVLNSLEDLNRFSINKGATYWLKLAHGSGGDLVQRIENFTNEALGQAIKCIRASVANAYSSSEFKHSTLEDFWPHNSVLPIGSRLVLESDVSACGIPILNGSQNILLHHGGKFEIVDTFRQVTSPSGSYIGSQKITADDLSPQLTYAIRTQTNKIAAYAHSLGYRGLLGFDFFVTGTWDAPEVFCIELNGRPTMSSVPALVAKKLPMLPEFLNVNIAAPSPILNYTDFREVVTLNGIDYSDISNSSGYVIIPLALRSLYQRSLDGNLECIHESNRAKVLVSGVSSQGCLDLIERLVSAGRLQIG